MYRVDMRKWSRIIELFERKGFQFLYKPQCLVVFSGEIVIEIKRTNQSVYELRINGKYICTKAGMRQALERAYKYLFL